MALLIDQMAFKVELGTMGRVQCEPGWHLAPEWSSLLSDYDLWFVWQGRGQMLTDAGSVDLRPGMLVWMRPGRRYVATQDPAARLGVTYVHFRLEAEGGRQPPSWTPPFEIMTTRNWITWDVVLNRVIQRGSEPGGLALAQAWLETALTDLIHENAGSSQIAMTSGMTRYHVEKIEEMTGQIRESPAGAPTVGEMASRAGYSVDHFSRIFLAMTGERPRAFVIRCRIQRACALLEESSLTVGMIAEAVGFHDIFHFSRLFRNRMGVSPSKYRTSLGVQK